MIRGKQTPVELSDFDSSFLLMTLLAAHMLCWRLSIQALNQDVAASLWLKGIARIWLILLFVYQVLTLPTLALCVLLETGSHVMWYT